MDDSLQLDDEKIKKLQEENSNLAMNLEKMKSMEAKKQEFLLQKVQENSELRKGKDKIIEERDAIRKQLTEMELRATGLESHNSELMMKCEKLESEIKNHEKS